ncbi:MAG: hypothetical protein NTX63_00535 [Candidatus Peregrinibacteria bacterium]|nr:hypothetical protein [Candidatus Peregrinibacteria bacterium]
MVIFVLRNRKEERESKFISRCRCKNFVESTDLLQIPLLQKLDKHAVINSITRETGQIGTEQNIVFILFDFMNHAIELRASFVLRGSILVKKILIRIKPQYLIHFFALFKILLDVLSLTFDGMNLLFFSVF